MIIFKYKYLAVAFLGTVSLTSTLHASLLSVSDWKEKDSDRIMRPIYNSNLSRQKHEEIASKYNIPRPLKSPSSSQLEDKKRESLIGATKQLLDNSKKLSQSVEKENEELDKKNERLEKTIKSIPRGWFSTIIGWFGS